MLHINPYLLPGTYSEADNPQRIVVVTEVANHVYNAATQLHEHHGIAQALVIYRPLQVKPDAHEVYVTPLDIFKSKFVKV